ncbi:VWDE [Symbiodinium sp. KB8]|nr:VWDE [Symbiodinium sp. KB8]
MWLPPVAHSKRPQANSAQPVSVRFVRQVGPATPCMLLALILSSLAAQTAYAWRQHRPWNTRPWCSEVVEPSWPFAYAKVGGQTVERKGRTASNLQHMGHECTTAGARSKCFRCEDFSCGPDLNSSCAFQVQGVPHTALPPSVPTVHDTPFAVGDAVRHRMDFGRAARTCVVLSGGRCLDGSGGDFSGCRVRCWGAGRPPPTPTATGWEHSKLVGQPQGRVFTLAGSSHGQFGHADGNASTALFNRPQGVHMNEAGQVFVADTDNHVIRLLNTRTGIVRTIAGVPGQAGYADGEGSVALFSHPVGVVSWRDGALQHVAVADTGNHRIRELVFQGGQWLVSTLAGGGEDLPLVLRADAVKSHGFADGVGTDARFDSPRGMAVSGTRLYVADTNNHLVRRVILKDGPGHQRGQTETYVGTVRSYPVPFLRGEPLASSAELPGCSPPCEEGVQGYVDATLNTSQLYHPYDVAIGEAGDNSAGEDNLIIVDGDRIRMAFSSAGPPVHWLGIASENRVVTLAGTTNAGESDGVGVEASFRKPRAAAVDAEGRVYVADAGSCRLRRLSPARRVAKPISCDATLDDVVQPSGCAMYDPALDAQDRTATSAFGHITYNYHHSRLDGKQVKACVGTPPPDAGIQSNASTLGPYAGTGWGPFLHKEDTGDLTTLRLRCPSGCAASPAAVAGDGLYAGTSSICKAAVHAGVLLNDAGGMVTVQVQRGVGERAGPGREGLGAPASSRFGVQSAALASADRTFNLSVYPLHVVEVQTIAGAPNAPIEELCGFQDSQPPMGALFNLPSGISLDASAVLGNTTYMVVADTDNHALRGVTAVCSQPCENGGPADPDRQLAQVALEDMDEGVYVCANGGNCTAPDACVCAPGWAGFDCRTPTCTNGYFDPQAPGLNPDPRFPRQGMYEFVNDRTVTIWENFPSFNEKFPGYMQEHPNYFSRFNGPLPDGNNYPVMYEKRPSLPPGDNTYEGWRRSQWWELARGAQWSKGRAAYTVPRYRRHCPGAAWKAVDLQTGNSTGWVLDTAQAYSPRIDYSDPRRVHAVGRWEEGGGECVDQVERGCFNGGTCTGPLTCSCLGGWEGDDCTLPICAAAVRSVSGQAGIPATRLSLPQGRSNSSLELLGSSTGGTFIQYRQCANNGNCTHPETCTCAMGWSGPNCTVPLCAQECMHGGTCIAPDTCKCPQWSAQFTDRRGQPYFKRPDGTSQLTGWTGFDCSTPICVQHERFILNNVRDPVRLSHTLSVWYQGNYEHPWAFKNPAPITWESHEDVSRVSEGRNIRVNHPNYIRESPETWVEGPVVEGEGLYACFNDGSCVAPDTCVCAEGWTGYDCNTPTCTPKCLRGGVCGDKDTCVCPRWPSRLHEVHPDVPQVVTGFNGSDCSMSMCAQGFLEPNCSVEARQLAGLTGDQTACYMCANGGVCTAPDTCTCTAEWKGFDCKTPVCRAHADVEILEQLNTVDPAVVTAFEQDPCLPNTLEEFLPENTWKGRGNCTAPNVCTCLCRDLTWFDVNGIQKEKPWVDELGRPLLPDQVYGRHTCLDGFEGAQDSQGRFTSCHLRIKVPTFIERYSIVLVAVVVTITVIVVVVYSFVRYQLLRRAKEYRRRRRRQRDKDDEDVDLEKEAQKVRMSKKAKKASSSAKKRKKRSKSKSKSRSKSD